MLSAILVMAIVVGALAFKAKGPDVCGYSRTLNATATKTTCPLIGEGDYNTTPEAPIDYVFTLPIPIGGFLKPNASRPVLW